MGSAAGAETDDTKLREVRHCPSCGSPMIAAPALQCAHCDKVHYLRCYAYRPRGGPYLAECVDLDLLTQGATEEEAIGKLQEAMVGYLRSAFDGNPHGLVLRPSPLSRRVRYHLDSLLNFVRRGKHQHFVLPAQSARLANHC